MEIIRKPFQGVYNIIRFNWHLYAISIALLLVCIVADSFFPSYHIFYIVAVLIFGSSATSLLISLYVYDLSGLYKLDWIKNQEEVKAIVNIHAGFDETSTLLKYKYPNATVQIIDFYDATKHTEVSIRRARKAYPASPQTIMSDTSNLPLPDAFADKVFVIFSAHEIRNYQERIVFFRELNRIIKPGGEIYVTEHLRDIPNFLAYNIGFFHFYSGKSWLRAFNKGGLILHQEIKYTPFISTFILSKNGTAL